MLEDIRLTPVQEYQAYADAYSKTWNDAKPSDILTVIEERAKSNGTSAIANTATDKAIKKIEEMIESYNSIDFPFGADFKVAILQDLKKLVKKEG